MFADTAGKFFFSNNSVLYEMTHFIRSQTNTCHRHRQRLLLLNSSEYGADGA